MRTMNRSTLMFLTLLGAVFAALVLCLATPEVHAAGGAVLGHLSDGGAYAGLGFAMLGKTTMAELRDKRNGIAKEARDMMESLPKDAKWTPEQVTSYDAKLDQIETIDASMAREQRLLDKTADEKFKGAGGVEIDNALAENKGRAAFNKLLRQGEKALTNEDWGHISNTMSTTTGSEGGFTVQTDVAKELISALKEYGGMREVSNVFSTAQGNPLNYPTTDGTAEVGEIVAENVQASDADASFGTVSLNAFKYSSKTITVPIELLQDSTVDIEAMIRARVVERIGRITNQHFTTGTGTGQPRGVITAAGTGKVGTTGQTTSVNYDDLIDLQHSVDPAYRKTGRGKFMFNDLTLRSIRKVKDTQGRPIFNPGYEVGVPGGAPDMLLGSPISINQDVAAMAANAKSIAFGDFGYYKIRDVMAIQLFRFADSPFIRKGQIGFLAWMRAGGNFTDAGGGAVKVYQNSAT